MKRSELHPDIQKALAELDRFINEADTQLQDSSKTPEEIKGLRIFRNMCSLYGASLLGSNMTEDEKIKLCHEIVRFD